MKLPRLIEKLRIGNDGIKIAASNVTGMISNLYYLGETGNCGIFIYPGHSGVRLQCSNIRISQTRANGVRIEGGGNIVSLENLWIENWNSSGIGFPAIDVVPGNTVYVGRGYLTNGGNGVRVGGGGTAILDNA